MNMSPETHLAAVQTKTSQVLGEKIKALQSEYTNSMQGTPPPDGLLTPESKATLINLGIDPQTFKIVIPAAKLLEMRKAGISPATAMGLGPQQSAGQTGQSGAAPPAMTRYYDAQGNPVQ